MFTRDTVNLTVGYSGGPFDWTYRRMILHYANLCVIAGGVDLFVIGSELRGLETIRGPAWTKAGTIDGSGKATWDYPFVAGLDAACRRRALGLRRAGLTKNLTTLKNLITYSADWSSWMGWQHPGEDGQWPHLDQLWAHPNIDVVAFDNYLPLSDWTTGGGGLDVANWTSPAPSGSWPPSPATMNGLGLSGVPSIYSIPYLKANIEGGESFNWYYSDGANGGRGLDPNGSGLMVSLPQGDRLAQTRNPYGANQQILRQQAVPLVVEQHAIRRSTTRAPDGSRRGRRPSGSRSRSRSRFSSMASRRPIAQPISRMSSSTPSRAESATPYWSIWDPAPGLTYLPRRDDTIAALALEAIYEYWNTDGHNATSERGPRR